MSRECSKELTRGQEYWTEGRVNPLDRTIEPIRDIYWSRNTTKEKVREQNHWTEYAVGEEFNSWDGTSMDTG